MNSQLHDTLTPRISTFNEPAVFNSTSVNNIKRNVQLKYRRDSLIAQFKNMKIIPNVIQNRQVYERQKTYHIYHRPKKPELTDNQVKALKQVGRPIKKTDTSNDIQNLAQAHENADIYFKRFREDNFLQFISLRLQSYSHDLWSQRYLINALEKSGLKQVGQIIREQYRNNTTKQISPRQTERVLWASYLQLRDLKTYGQDTNKLFSELIEINTDRLMTSQKDEEQQNQRLHRYKSETDKLTEPENTITNQIEQVIQQTKYSHDTSHIRTSETKKRQRTYYFSKKLKSQPNEKDVKSYDGAFTNGDISSQLKFELSVDLNQRNKEEFEKCNQERLFFQRKFFEFGDQFKQVQQENQELIKNFRAKTSEISRGNSDKFKLKKNAQNIEKIKEILNKRNNFFDQLINHKKRKVSKKKQLDDFD